jgi:hypothetical protein
MDRGTPTDRFAYSLAVGEGRGEGGTFCTVVEAAMGMQCRLEWFGLFSLGVMSFYAAWMLFFTAIVAWGFYVQYFILY